MPWIYYGDDSYCSCPHCESEEGGGVEYSPNEPSATRYDWENQSETPDEPEYHFQPLPGTSLFYRLSTYPIGTPFASLHVWLADTPNPFESQEVTPHNHPKETRVQNTSTQSLKLKNIFSGVILHPKRFSSRKYRNPSLLGVLENRYKNIEAPGTLSPGAFL